MEKIHFKKGIIIGVIFLMIITLFPTNTAQSNYYSDGLVIIVGRCNFVESTGLWLFGLTGIYKREVDFVAHSQDGEVINIMIFSSEIGFYLSEETISIHMEDTNGLLFSGEKALIFKTNPQRVFAICKAKDIWVTI